MINNSIIGSDEVGNGSYFGSLITCATYVTPENENKLKLLNIKDSKLISDKKIILLSKKIQKIIPFYIIKLTPEKYNKIQPKFNAVYMKVLLHNQVIFLLLKKIFPKIPNLILIDKFTTTKAFNKYIKKAKNKIKQNLILITKGEKKCIAIAAASIISRHIFIKDLKNLSKKIGLKLPSGANKISDKIAKKILINNNNNINKLKKYVKLHFKNTKRIINF